jgi:arabinose-5-phosphate isomerase
MNNPFENILNAGRSTLAAEARALLSVERNLDESFAKAVECIHNCHGRLIITGMGKSGHVAHKIAATLTSTGTRAIFLHAAEALHGDLGIIAPEDVVMALSYSGETDEVVRVAEYVATNHNTLIAMTGCTTSRLAQHAAIVLDTHIEDDGTILDIVPTASTTTQIAMGDAIAMALMQINNFKADDFARVHPGGYIEKRIKESLNK